MQNKQPTRRGILSTISSIYDPIGFVAPLSLQGKQVLQELCREGVEWDEQFGRSSAAICSCLMTSAFEDAFSLTILENLSQWNGTITPTRISPGMANVLICV